MCRVLVFISLVLRYNVPTLRLLSIPWRQVSTNVETMYFIADTDKEKEDWINAIGRAIVRHSRSLQDEEVHSY